MSSGLRNYLLSDDIGMLRVTETADELQTFLAEHAPSLKALYEVSAAARWDASCEEFARTLHRSTASHCAAGRNAATLEAYLRGLHLEDLALACALRKGCEAAWKTFVADYRPVLRAAARAIVGPGREAHAEELADSLYAELYGIRPGSEYKRPLLDYFHGRSKLSTWLRTVLAQRHVDSLRASRRLQPLDSDGGIRSERPIQRTESVDLDRARLLPALANAISAALSALAAPDRLLLLLYYVQELTLAQIARMRGVHEATVSRHLQSIRAEFRKRVDTILAGGASLAHNSVLKAPLSPAEIRACLDYAFEDWPFDLAQILTADAAATPTDGNLPAGVQEIEPVSFHSRG